MPNTSDTQIIHGFHAVTARLRGAPDTVREIYFDAARDDKRARALLALAASRNARVIEVDGRRLDGLTGRARHQGVAASVAPVKPATHIDDVLEALDEPALLLILDGITDPHNLGACLRVADAMGVHAVIAPRDRAAGINATVSKVASGAAETMPYITVTNLARTMRELKDKGVWITGADESAPVVLHAANLDGPRALVLGAEGEGMRRLTREHCDELVRIPMLGGVESLNVSVSAGIVLYEARRQRFVQI
jgi:23S rRNA (guanosine2251-2'-O)-methyltransferase